MSLIIRFLIAISVCLFAIPLEVVAQQSSDFTIARIKYRGGGDWYNNPTSLENLIEFTRQNVPISISSEYEDVDIGSRDLFKYPFAFLTGHGNISINSAEASNLRQYLDNGGFLYIDDDYGLDKYARQMLDQVYPNEELVELPFEHDIYHLIFDFSDGPPKIHEHDGKPAQGFGIFRNGRLVVYYTYESNLGDGWADPNVHNDPEEVRQKALKMGANILVYALTESQ